MIAAMKRREFITVLGGAATAYVCWPMTTRAQVPERHIGVLMGLAEDDRDTKARLFGLRQGLEKLGWVEGRNVRIDYRFAPGGARVEVFAKSMSVAQLRSTTSRPFSSRSATDRSPDLKMLLHPKQGVAFYSET